MSSLWGLLLLHSALVKGIFSRFYQTKLPQAQFVRAPQKTRWILVTGSYIL